tara:strand:- start:25 stop:600 length:576 start_codon:yes stop_codon:yes gene_type:complete
MGMFDYLKCEYSLPLTEEIKKELPEQDWSTINFQTKSFDCALDNYMIEDDGQIYVEKLDRFINNKGELQESSTGIERVEWSGEVNFYFDFFKEDYDIWIEFKALVWKGELKEIELLNFSKTDNDYRVELQEKFTKEVKKREDKHKKWWWKPFKVWCSVVRGPLFIIRYALGWIVRLTWKIERWLTGGTFRF